MHKRPASVFYRFVEDQAWVQGPETVEAIAATRASLMGQAGLSAFFQKVDPPWVPSSKGCAPICAPNPHKIAIP